MFDAVVPMVVLFVLLAMSVLIALEIGKIYERLKSIGGKLDGVKKQIKFANKRFKSIEVKLVKPRISEEDRREIGIFLQKMFKEAKDLWDKRDRDVE